MGKILSLLTILLFIILLLPCLGISENSQQPIQFNHKKHKDQGVECVNCHNYIREESFAGIPKLQTCLECHENPITKSTEEEKIRSFAKKGVKLEWIRVYRLPQHVYFSHRRHVALAKLECINCHGAIDNTTKPPLKPLKILMMNDCIDCHKKSKAHNVSTDCIDCHK